MAPGSHSGDYRFAQLASILSRCCADSLIADGETLAHHCMCSGTFECQAGPVKPHLNRSFSCCCLSAVAAYHLQLDCACAAAGNSAVPAAMAIITKAVVIRTKVMSRDPRPVVVMLEFTVNSSVLQHINRSYGRPECPNLTRFCVETRWRQLHR